MFSLDPTLPVRMSCSLSLPTFGIKIISCLPENVLENVLENALENVLENVLENALESCDQHFA